MQLLNLKSFAGATILSSMMMFASLTIVAAQGLPDLRVLPLGDSITKGSGSTDNNGYRGPLREKLLNYQMGTGRKVDMIGTLRHGSMVDSDHEGHSGEYLRQIKEYWKRPIKALPNVVLVHAGTNNMDKDVDVDLALGFMEEIIDGLFDESPGVVVLVAPVIWANNPVMQRRTDVFNENLLALVKVKQAIGNHILPVPISIGLDDLSDIKHPNNRGYQKMASAWFLAIIDAADRGWLSAPTEVNNDNLPGLGLGDSGSAGGGGGGGGGELSCTKGIWQKKGTIFTDFRIWEEVGTIINGVQNARRDKVILADLDGDGIMDYILADDDGTVRAWINSGKPKQWKSLGKVNPPWSKVNGSMIRLADVDNDGKADLIVLYSDGSAKVWKNTKNGEKFEALDSGWATGLDSRDKIRIVDIDGDGFADYVVMNSRGAVKWAKNTGNNGKDSGKANWAAAESIAPGPPGMPANRARLIDLDGDKQADYIVVHDSGAVEAFRNTGNLNSDTSRRNWEDLGTIAPGVSGITGDMIEFADMTGDGYADFLAVAKDGSIRMWRNLGILGSKGASLTFADLTGDGRADLISVNDKGKARAWLNKGVDKWESIGEIAPGLDEDLSNSRIVFADVNGDKRADYLVVYGGGAVKAYLNTGSLSNPGSNGRIWEPPGGIVIAPGVGEPGRKIHFADLNGDGYADYLVVFDGGAVDAYLNRQNIPPTDGERIWRDVGTVATGVSNIPGAKVRFADLSGDGKAEYIIQYDGGAARALLNTGNIPDVGRPRNWYDLGTVATGVSPQGPVHYADIDGDGKADYLVVFGDGTINAYINNCDWKLQNPNDGGDDGGGGGGSGLDKYSTCKELMEEEKQSTFPSKVWDEMETTPYWHYWVSLTKGATSNVLGSFAAEWGFRNVRCFIWGSCSNLNLDCNDETNKAGGGQAQVILQSFQNVHDFYQAYRVAIERTESLFSILNPFLKDYWPTDSEDDSVLLNILLGIIPPVWDIGAKIAGKVPRSKGDGDGEDDEESLGEQVASTLFSTIAGQITSAMESDDTEVDLDQDIASLAFNFINSSNSVVYEMHDTIINDGHFVSADGAKFVIDDMFADGAWLDSSNIPLINTDGKKKQISTLELGDWLFNWLHASIVRYAWSTWEKNIVYVVGHKMSWQQFKSSDSIDAKLKLYYNGIGYFIQSYSYKKKAASASFTYRLPAGYEVLYDDKLNTNFNVSDIMLSSIDWYNKHGLAQKKGEANVPFEEVLKHPDWDSWRSLTPRLAGTFNLPICVLDWSESTPDPAGTFLRFAEGSFSSNINAGHLCREAGSKDRNGELFFEYLHHHNDMDCSIN